MSVPAASGEAPSAQFVSIGSKGAARTEPVPISCMLGSDPLKGRIEEWQRLLIHIGEREPIVGGVRAVFKTTVPLDELMRLTAAEQNCCQFLSFAITVDTRGIALEVAAPADALPIVRSLFGSAV
jgi:hypothetical protein